MALQTYLLESGLFADHEIESHMENSRLYAGKKNLGLGYEIGRVEYTAIFNIEPCTQPPSVLLALIASWLIEFDNERFKQGLAEPSFDIDALSHTTADIEIEVQFSETIQMVEQNNGPISHLGKTYACETVPIEVFSQVAVGHDTGQAVDLPVTT
ncbi:phage tail protein [Dasania marina]|uniref:phage tail protein n=1 Tax=Dasania marina TaxID=471499 RepID=UPI001461500F|nr:phage tail protein [Dasania marina]